MLQTVACFATFVARLRHLAAAGPAQRSRIIALGGAHVLVSKRRAIAQENRRDALMVAAAPRQPRRARRRLRSSRTAAPTT